MDTTCITSMVPWRVVQIVLKRDRERYQQHPGESLPGAIMADGCIREHHPGPSAKRKPRPQATPPPPQLLQNAQPHPATVHDGGIRLHPLGVSAKRKPRPPATPPPPHLLKNAVQPPLPAVPPPMAQPSLPAGAPPMVILSSARAAKIALQPPTPMRPRDILPVPAAAILGMPVPLLGLSPPMPAMLLLPPPGPPPPVFAP